MRRRGVVFEFQINQLIVNKGSIRGRIKVV